jgi:hypothetical protein
LLSREAEALHAPDFRRSGPLPSIDDGPPSSTGGTTGARLLAAKWGAETSAAGLDPRVVDRPTTSDNAGHYMDGRLRFGASHFVFARSPNRGPATPAEVSAMPWLDPNFAPFLKRHIRASAERFSDGGGCVRLEGWDGQGRLELTVPGRKPVALGPVSYDQGRNTGAVYLSRDQMDALGVGPGRGVCLVVRGEAGRQIAYDAHFEFEEVNWDARGQVWGGDRAGRLDGQQMKRNFEFQGSPLDWADAHGFPQLNDPYLRSPNHVGANSRGPVVTSYIDLLGYRLSFFTRELERISMAGVDSGALRGALAELGRLSEQLLELRQGSEWREPPIWRAGQSPMETFFRAFTPRRQETMQESGDRFYGLQERAMAAGRDIEALIRRTRTILQT